MTEDRQDRFLRLFLAHQRDLRAFLRSLLWDAARAEDAFQDVALVLWKQFDRYDDARPFLPWARGVAALEVLHVLRRDRRVDVPFGPQALQAIIEAHDRLPAVPAAFEGALLRCLELLPERSRMLVALRYAEGFKPTEIAARLGGSLDAIHKALYRIRRALQQCIERRLEPASVPP